MKPDIDAKHINVFNFLDDSIVLLDMERRKDHLPKQRHYAGDWATIIDEKYEGGCIRQQFYEWIGISPTDIEPKRMYNALAGIYLEDMIASLYEKHPLIKHVNKQREIITSPKELKYDIKGKSDFILTFANDRRTMIELKTTHSRAIKDRRFGMKYHGPKLPYRMQISHYKQHDTEQYDEYVIAVFSREDFNRLSWVMGEDFDEINTMDYRCYEVVERYLEKGQLPPKSYNESIDKYPCSWCKFRTRCWEYDRDLDKYVEEELIREEWGPVIVEHAGLQYYVK